MTVPNIDNDFESQARAVAGRLPFPDLEETYDRLAVAIDRVGPENERLFLAKLALILCHKVGTMKDITEAIDMACADLPAQGAR